MSYFSVKEKKFFYEEHGAGFPVLFGHSYLWDAAMWSPQIAHFSPVYRCIVPEVWGHGQSDVVPQIPYSIEALAEDHHLLITSLKVEQYALIGLSVGGMWATQLALEYPEAVKALVLMDTYVGPEPEETHQRYFAMLDAVEHAGMIPPPLIEQIVPLFFSPETLTHQPSLVNRFKESLASIPSDRIPSVVALGRAIFSRASLLERLGEIDVPTLVIVGKDDRSRPPHEARIMAEKIRGAQLAVISGAGHVSNLEQAQEINGILETFLKKYV